MHKSVEMPRTSSFVVGLCVLVLLGGLGPSGGVLAQPYGGPDTLWTRVHHLSDLGELLVGDVVSLADGSFFVSGSFYTRDETQCGLYLMKLDSLGNLLWRQPCGDSTRCALGGAMCRFDTDLFVVAGPESGDDPGDPCAVLVDVEGQVVWDRVYHMAGYQDKVTVCPCDNYCFLIVCKSIDMHTLVESILWIKVNEDGDTVWTRTFTIPGYRVWPTAVTRTSDGGYAISGYAGITGVGGPVLLLKLDAQGVAEFYRTYVFGRADDGLDITTLNDGTHVVSGVTDDWNGSPYRSFALRVGAAGDSLWSFMSTSAEGYSQSRMLVATPDGGFAVFFDFDPHPQLLRFSAVNELLWRRPYRLMEPYEVNRADCITQDLAGGYVVVGHCHAADTIITYPLLSVIKTQPDPVAETARDRPVPVPLDLSLRVYPNPFNSTAQIEYVLPVTQRVSLRLYDVLGREVAVMVEGTQSAGHHRVLLHGAGLASGMYFVRLDAIGMARTRKVVLLR